MRGSAWRWTVEVLQRGKSEMTLDPTSLNLVGGPGRQTCQQHSVANGKRCNSWVDKNFNIYFYSLLNIFSCLGGNFEASFFSVKRSKQIKMRRSAAPTRRLPCGAVPCTAWRRGLILAERRFWCLWSTALLGARGEELV